jgi:hypothetical protein
MSGDDGLRDEMRRFFARRPDPLALDEVTAARLLSGQLDPADAPPGFAGVARVLGAATAPGRPDELVGEDRTLAVYQVARGSRRRPRGRARGLRLATLISAGLLVLGGVAGAVSSGALPDGAQSVAHDALGAVGVSVPAPTPQALRRPGPARRSPRPVGPSLPSVRPGSRPVPPTGHPPGTPLSTPPRTRRPTDALLLAACRAYLEGRVSPTGGRAAANAYRYLASRAGGAANVAGFCQGVVRSAGP